MGNWWKGAAIAVCLLSFSGCSVLRPTVTAPAPLPPAEAMLDCPASPAGPPAGVEGWALPDQAAWLAGHVLALREALGVCRARHNALRDYAREVSRP